MNISESGQGSAGSRLQPAADVDKWNALQRGQGRTGQRSRDDLVAQVASLGHDAWRASRQRADGKGYEPRVKEVKDEAWIAQRGGQTSVDIANTEYGDLPRDWQVENKASAEVAVDQVLQAAGKGRPHDAGFLERAAEAVHVAWLERNGEWAPEEQKLPYAQLSEAEKEKDRFWVRNAISLFANSP